MSFMVTLCIEIDASCYYSKIVSLYSVFNNLFKLGHKMAHFIDLI